jgi:hypothetical protein
MTLASLGRDEAPLTARQARAIAKEAYIYGFPLVDDYRVLHAYFVNHDGPELKAPWNEIHSEARVFTPEDRAIQTPNSDTPYSQLGVDLRTEPLVLTVPAVAANRYYALQLIDLYTFDYAYVGTRATGSSAGRFLLAGPSWRGEKPAGIDAVIRSETELGWIRRLRCERVQLSSGHAGMELPRSALSSTRSDPRRDLDLPGAHPAATSMHTFLACLTETQSSRTSV